ncbi:MAG: hypothetical protein FJ034_02695 [Chloroflexi bacterium]|nr:hypothetical protein [Chloroflexota bacterium]
MPASGRGPEGPRGRRGPRLVLVAGLVILILWTSWIKPAGQAAILVGDIYGEQLLGANVAALITPEPRIAEGSGTFAGATMRVTTWRPGWGDRHPAIMLVPGASPRGNEEPALRRFGVSLARAGYLVLLPELPFLKEGRFDEAGAAQIDAAFAHTRGLAETRDRSVGAFGISVGGGMMFVAAGRDGSALRDAAFLSVLGAYYDIDTYLASLASRTQRFGGRDAPWEPSAEAQERLPLAALDLAPVSERDAVRRALAPASYDEALRRMLALPPATRARFDAVSPERVWQRIVPPLYWIHDPEDAFEPLAEAERAAAADRDGRMVLVVPRLVQHAVPSGDEARARGPLFVVGEIWQLLSLAFEILRTAG